MKKKRLNLNSQGRKTLNRMKANPADVRYSDFQTLLNQLGFEESNKGKTSGSRVKFYHPETGKSIWTHKPHPKDVMDTAAVKCLRAWLDNWICTFYEDFEDDT